MHGLGCDCRFHVTTLTGPPKILATICVQTYTLPFSFYCQFCFISINIRHFSHMSVGSHLSRAVNGRKSWLGLTAVLICSPLYLISWLQIAAAFYRVPWLIPYHHVLLHKELIHTKCSKAHATQMRVACDSSRLSASLWRIDFPWGLAGQ